MGTRDQLLKVDVILNELDKIGVKHDHKICRMYQVWSKLLNKTRSELISSY